MAYAESEVPTGLDPREPRAVWKFMELPDHTQDGQGLFDASGEVGMVIAHDNYRVERELSNLEWVRIAAASIGAGIWVTRNGELSPEAREENTNNSLLYRGSYTGKMPTNFAVMVAGITEEELLDALLTFDPRENRKQV